MNYVNNKFADTTTQIKISKGDLSGLDSAPDGVTGAGVTGLLNTVYIIAGIVAVVVIIVGGVRYVTSGGDATGVKNAKNTILYAVVGLVIIIAAAAITGFVMSNVGK